MPSDYELYCRFLSGDTESYDELMIRYGSSLTFFLHGYLHNWQDAEDLMIEAFARIMVKKPRIGDGGAFKAYLFKTGRNLATRFHSVRIRMKVFSFDDLTEETADGILTEEKLLSEERKRILHLCMERIDPACREAIWLVYFEDMSYAQAAQVMGVRKKKIDNLLLRGKQHLKRELEKEGIRYAHE